MAISSGQAPYFFELVGKQLQDIRFALIENAHYGEIMKITQTKLTEKNFKTVAITDEQAIVIRDSVAKVIP